MHVLINTGKAWIYTQFPNQKFCEQINLYKLVLEFTFFLDDNKTTTYLAFGYQSSEFQSTCNSLKHVRVQRPVEFLINLYREHGTKKLLCDSIFDLKEQLIALQLVMAQLNKEVPKLFLTLSTK